MSANEASHSMRLLTAVLYSTHLISSDTVIIHTLVMGIMGLFSELDHLTQLTKKIWLFSSETALHFTTSAFCNSANFSTVLSYD